LRNSRHCEIILRAFAWCSPQTAPKGGGWQGALTQGGDRLFHGCAAGGVRRVGAQEFISRIGQAIKESCAAQGIKTGAFRYFGAKRISFQLEPFGKAARADICPDLLGFLYHGVITAGCCCKDAGQQRALGCALLLLRDVARDVMGCLMPDNKGKFINIAGVRDQRKVEGEDRPALRVKSLKGIGGLTGAVVHRYLKVAVNAAGTRAAYLFRDRFYSVDSQNEIAGSR
jgi:hypothetical protein